MHDISRDRPTGGGMNVPASCGQLTRQQANLRRDAAVAVKDRKGVSL
jgi:hypothetical protein